jgi:hypothetical protein
MTEKKLTEEELEQAAGGAKFTISSGKVEGREALEAGDSAEGVILDPSGSSDRIETLKR